MTDLYEAGDINQSEGADDDIDDVDDLDDGDDIDDEVGAGNEIGDEDGGTALAVLTYLARSLSNDPDSVVIETEERRGGVRLNLHVAPDDMGRVIGRRGRVAQAIRTVVAAAGARDGVKTSVDIDDD